MSVITRRAIVILIIIVLVAGTVVRIKTMKANEKSRFKKQETQKPVTEEVYTIKAAPFQETLTLTGTVKALNSIDLIPEATGKLLKGKYLFQEGQAFKKGEIIYRIDGAITSYDLKSRKSSFLNLLIRMIPDLSLDYPQSEKVWRDYITNFSENKSLKSLPEPQSEKERLFIASREIYTNFYAIKSLEARLAQYSLYAPFSGVLTQTNVKVGTPVAASRSIGTFTQTGNFEVVLSVPASQLSLVEVGEKVMLSVLENGEKVEAIVNRLNKKIDQSSRTVKIYLSVKSDKLMEGSFVTATLQGKSINNASQIPSRYLVDRSAVFVKQGDRKEKKEITIISRNNGTLVITGLADGATLVR